MAGTSTPGTLPLSRRMLDPTTLMDASCPHPRAADAELRMADAVRALAIDAVEAAGSGHLSLPMGMADVATTLWARVLRFDATDPTWPDRDRFVLATGDGSMLLYALLYLTGHPGMDIEALKRFRQLDSPAAGQPEHGHHPAIEMTAGPHGQGLATAVGMALAERMLASRFGRSLVDHRTWVIGSDRDQMGGISHEAACLAGRLRLEKLTVLCDENGSGNEQNDTLKRFAACGWATKCIDGHDPTTISSALIQAVRSKKPSLIVCRTRRDWLAHATAAEGSAAWTLAIERMRLAMDWPHESFETPDDVIERWNRAGIRGTPGRRGWLKRLNNHPMRQEFERVMAGRLPETWHEANAAFKAEITGSRPAFATCQSSDQALKALAGAIPELVGGSTAAHPEMNHPSAAPITSGNYSGRHMQFGVRGHGMAACLNGMALHSGLIPYGTAPLVVSDCMRPALRLAALMRQRVIYVLTHDSIGLGADGPTQQPVEHLASLRATPGLSVLRPADAMETAECWELALKRADGPSLLVLSQQPVPAIRVEAGENRCARGGYVLAEADGPRQATLIATGSEVSVALEARHLLAQSGLAVAVISLPCWDLFAAQDESYRTSVLGTVLRVGIEAACGFGWERWLGPHGIFIGMTGFGASAPAETLFRHFGITPEATASAVRKRLQPSTPEGS